MEVSPRGEKLQTAVAFSHMKKIEAQVQVRLTE